jgi:serine/threonine protein kinase
LYILLSGEPPFSGDDDDDEIIAKVIKGVYSMKGGNWDEVSDGAKDFVKKMLEVNFDSRVSAKVALEDKWFE